MVINGEYTENPQGKVSESCTYTWQYVIYSPVGSLYTFVLKPEVQAEFEHQVENARTTFIRHNFRSLEILELMTR
jgi:DNA repair protein RecO (recombination protein O)